MKTLTTLIISDKSAKLKETPYRRSKDLGNMEIFVTIVWDREDRVIHIMIKNAHRVTV